MTLQFAYSPNRALFARPGLVVTWDLLYINDKQYEIAELHDVVKVPRPVSATVTTVVAVSGLEGAGFLAVLAAQGRWWIPMVAAPAVLVAVLGAGVVAARRPRLWQLRAVYRRRPVLLWSTRDERQFGQVSRAILRAIEVLPLPLE
jgi:hypothetical protein